MAETNGLDHWYNMQDEKLAWNVAICVFLLNVAKIC